MARATGDTVRGARVVVETGDTVVADSVGRFALWISGGRSGGDARLATTNGSIRLSDDDLFGLINALKGREGDRCEIVEATKGFEAPAVFLDNIFDEGDPPSVSYAGAGLVPEMIRAVEKRSPRTMLMGEYDGGEAPEVDQDFISRQEGGQLLNAYTLDPDRFAESGVTVGTGVDLGQLTQDQLDNMDVPQELKDKLQDYVGLRGQDAVDYLRDNPLTVSKEEADQLDRISLETTETQVGTHFDNASQSSFSELPSEARTVIVDLSYQYGTNLATRTPRFWAAVTEGRWDDAVSELRNFGDRHGDRRNAEADLLQQAIDSGRLRGQPEN